MNKNNLQKNREKFSITEMPNSLSTSTSALASASNSSTAFASASSPSPATALTPAPVLASASTPASTLTLVRTSAPVLASASASSYAPASPSLSTLAPASTSSTAFVSASSPSPATALVTASSTAYASASASAPGDNLINISFTSQTFDEGKFLKLVVDNMVQNSKEKYLFLLKQSGFVDFVNKTAESNEEEKVKKVFDEINNMIASQKNNILTRLICDFLSSLFRLAIKPLLLKYQCAKNFENFYDFVDLLGLNHLPSSATALFISSFGFKSSLMIDVNAHNIEEFLNAFQKELKQKPTNVSFTNNIKNITYENSPKLLRGMAKLASGIGIICSPISIFCVAYNYSYGKENSFDSNSNLKLLNDVFVFVPIFLSLLTATSNVYETRIKPAVNNPEEASEKKSCLSLLYFSSLGFTMLSSCVILKNFYNAEICRNDRDYFNNNNNHEYIDALNYFSNIVNIFAFTLSCVTRSMGNYLRNKNFEKTALSNLDSYLRSEDNFNLSSYNNDSYWKSLFKVDKSKREFGDSLLATGHVLFEDLYPSILIKTCQDYSKYFKTIIFQKNTTITSQEEMMSIANQEGRIKNESALNFLASADKSIQRTPVNMHDLSSNNNKKDNSSFAISKNPSRTKSPENHKEKEYNTI